MNQQPRLFRRRDSPRRWRPPEPTVPCVHLERGLSLLSPQVTPASCPRFNPPLAHHNNDIRLQWWCRPGRPPTGNPSIGDDRQQRTSVLFSGACKPTPCSVRKVSMQELNAVIPPQVLLVARAASEADDRSDDDDESKQ
jgi:hypothetical protein